MKIKNLIFKESKIIFVFCVIFILFSGVEVKSQEVEIEKIVGEVSIDSQKGAIFNYTYLMKFSFRKNKFGGRKFTRLYEAILPSRYSLNRLFGHPLILLEDSEKMVTDEQVRISRQEVAVRLEKAEKDEKLATTEKPPEDGGYWTVGLSNSSKSIKVDVLQLLKNARFSNLQRREVEGRSIVSIEFAPKPEAVFEKSLSYLSKIEGQIRIDEADKRVIAVEGYAVGELAKHKEKSDDERRKESVFLYLQTKVAEGFWFPHFVRLNFSKHPEIFESCEVEYAFSNYKKGRVDIQYVEKPTQSPVPTTSGEQ